MTLYELTEELLQIIDIAEEDGEDEALIGSWEAVSGEFDDKVEAYCKVITQLDADAQALKSEEKRLSERRKRIEKRTDWMRQKVKEYMTAVGKRKAGGTLFTASIKTNGGVLPLIVEGKAADLPAEFQRVVYEADNGAIRDALEAGRELPFAHFGERGESLKIS